MSPPLDVEAIEGDVDDPNCLHCYLAPVIQAWAEAHPLKELGEMVLELAEVLGEMAASDAIDSSDREFALGMAEVSAELLKRATEMRASIARKFSNDAAAAHRKKHAH